MIPVSLKAKCIGVMKHDPAGRAASAPQLYCVSLKFEKTDETPVAAQINLVTVYGGEFKPDAIYSVDISFDQPAPTSAPAPKSVPAATTKGKGK